MDGATRKLAWRAAVAGGLLVASTWVVACGSSGGGARTATTESIDRSDLPGPPITEATTTVARQPVANELRVDLMEFGFKGPKTVPAGTTRVIVHDMGGVQHELQVGRLHDDKTWTDIEDLLHGPVPDAVATQMTMVGGIPGVEPGGTASTVVDLEPGTYALMCFITAADGKSHLAHGMVQRFDVTEPEGKAVEAPQSKGDIVLADMTITLPKDFDGTGTWRVVNTGEQQHAATIMRVAEGATRKEVLAYLQAEPKPEGEPVVAAMGGAGSIDPGQQEWVELDLPKGRYVLVSFVPDLTKGGIPQFLEGMITEYEQP